MMLLGALVLSFATVRQGAELDEGSDRFETLVRLASAHAANTGRKVQIYFKAGEPGSIAQFLEAAPGRIGVAWEPEPLDSPGVMLDLIEPGWDVEELNELVGIESVRPLGSAEPALPAESGGMWEPGAGGEEEPLFGDLMGWLGTLTGSWKPIEFYPDGSCDSAEVVLVSRDADDRRRVSVQIVGVTGQVRRTVIAPPAEEGAPEPEDAAWDEFFE